MCREMKLQHNPCTARTTVLGHSCALARLRDSRPLTKQAVKGDFPTPWIHKLGRADYRFCLPNKVLEKRISCNKLRAERAALGWPARAGRQERGRMFLSAFSRITNKGDVIWGEERFSVGWMFTETFFSFFWTYFLEQVFVSRVFGPNWRVNTTSMQT